MLTQSHTPSMQNQLILENPDTSESYYSLCSFKERQEKLAVEKLRSFDEIPKSKTLYQKFFGFSSWSKQKPVRIENQSEDLQAGEDGISLLYKRLSVENESVSQKTRSSGSLLGWQVCGDELHNKVDCLKGKMWKNTVSARKTEGKSESFTLSGASNPNKKEAFVQSKPRKSEFVEPKTAKRDVQPSPREEIPRQQTHRSATSPHKAIKFHQFSNTNDYIRYYRDHVTHSSIRQHFFNYVERKTSKMRPRTYPYVEMKSNVNKESPAAKMYRLHISDKATFGILKVGPCPTLKLNSSPNKNDENEAGWLPTKSVSDAERNKGLSKNSDCLMANVSRLLRDQAAYSLSSKKGTRTRESYPIPTANTTDFDEVQQLRSEEGITSATDDVKLKKIGLRVNKSLAPRLRAKRKAARFNNPKQNQRTTAANKAKQGKSTQRGCGLSTPPGTGVDKEFLHITKPKVIGINPASQKGSQTKFNSLPYEDQLVASVALYPWTDDEGGIPKGRLIETNHIINRNLLKSRLPEKGFQVCITPSTYPNKSTVGMTTAMMAEEQADDISTHM